jgi:nucleoside 2-deoxyribosyltransferase
MFGVTLTLSPDKYGDVATSELQGIQSADLVVVLLPGGYGTHVEIGAALAFGKPVILHAPDQHTLNTPYPCVFHYHPLIKLIVSEVVNVEEFITIMTSMLENKPS